MSADVRDLHNNVMGLDLFDLFAAQEHNLVFGCEGKTVGTADLGFIFNGGWDFGAIGSGLSGQFVDGKLELIHDRRERLVRV